MGAYHRAMKRIGKTKTGAMMLKTVAPPIDLFLSRLSSGRRTLAGTVLPTFVLIHTGAKSAKEYRTPVSFIRMGEGFALAATNFGQAHHPGWSYNLETHPEASVFVDGSTIPVRARRASTQEKAELWPRFVEMWPGYDSYVERSGRDIRVFILERR